MQFAVFKDPIATSVAVQSFGKNESKGEDRG